MIGPWLKDLAGWGAELLERPLEDFIDLETADLPAAPTSFVGRNRPVLSAGTADFAPWCKSAAPGT